MYVKMNSLKTPVRVLLVLAGLAVFQAVALADMMYYQGPNGASLGGVYTSPYKITVNGVTTYLVCDDAEARINPGLSWTASEHNLSEVTSTGPQKFRVVPTGANYTLEQGYNAVGYLASVLLSNWQTVDPVITGELSFAIWDIFSPGVDGYLANLSLEQRAAVQRYKEDALTNHSSTADPHVRIYTPAPLSASQEFIGTVPDSGMTLMLLGGALMGLETLRRRFRVEPVFSQIGKTKG